MHALGLVRGQLLRRVDIPLQIPQVALLRVAALLHLGHMRARSLHIPLAIGDGILRLGLILPGRIHLLFGALALLGDRVQLRPAAFAVAGQTLLVALDAVHVMLGVLQGEHGVGQGLLRGLALAPGFVQRGGERLGAGVHLVGVALLLCSLLLDALKLPRDLPKALVQLRDGRAHGVQAHGVRVVIRLGRLEALGVARHGDLLLVQLVLGALAALLFARAAAFHLGHLLLGGLRPRAHFLQLRGQLLHLALAAQQVLRLLLNAAAGHAAAGVHHVALQRHQPESMPARAHDGDAAVQVPGHHGAAQQAFHYAAVDGIVAAQLARHADTAGQGQHLALARGEGAAPNRIQRQERGPSQPVFAQIVNQDLGVLLGFGHDVLHRAAQGHVHGGFVFARHLQKHGYHVVHTLEAAAAGIGQGVSHGVLIALVAVLQFLERFEARVHGAHALQVLLRLLLLCQNVGQQLLCALLERLQPFPQACETVLLAPKVIAGLLERGGELLLLLLLLGQLGGDLGAAGVHLLLHGALTRLRGAHVLHAA